MMNFRNESFPASLSDLINQAEKYATYVHQKLNAIDCPTITELYAPDKRGRIILEKVKLEALGYKPNNYLSKADKSAEKKNELKGLYIIGELLNNKVVPIYVGISRTIFRRIKQHAWGKRHNECSLAYLIAKKEAEENNLTPLTRKHTIQDKTLLNNAKDTIKKYRIMFIPEEDDFKLYFYEVALAGLLKTKWNSFRTHLFQPLNKSDKIIQ